MEGAEKVLLGYGPLGALVILGGILLWKIISKIMTERDEERKYSMEMEKQFRTEVVPAMIQMTEAAKEILKLTTDQAAAKRVEDAVAAAMEKVQGVQGVQGVPGTRGVQGVQGIQGVPGRGQGGS